MKGFISGFVAYVRERKVEIVIILLFIGVAVVAVLYSTTLPLTTHGDTYVTLLANKALSDPTFPDRDLILNFDFKPYLYTNILAFLNAHFSLLYYKLFLLFVLVFVTGYCAYVALRVLGFSRSISIFVALVALMPRVGVGGEAWGVFVADDVLGRTFALPFMWLLTAFFLKRRFERKSLWPVFVFSGLASYVHPVSMIFFNGIMFLVYIFWIIRDKKYGRDIKDFALSCVAFVASASLLLSKIFLITKHIRLASSGFVVATASEYYDALVFRVKWDFVPYSAVYTAHFLVINFVFIVAMLYVIWNLYKGKLSKEGILYLVMQFGFVVIGLSIFLSFFLPNTELWLVRHYGFPFIIQQSSRFFKYYYLGEYVVLAVAMALLFGSIQKNKKILFTTLLIVGIVSSTLGFEIFKFAVGYKNYKQEYIPNILQKNKLPDDDFVYPRICEQLKKAGIKKDDLVISDYFQLRYYCGTRLFTTFEEGSIYFMLGKNELVWWHKMYVEQNNVLYDGSPDEMMAFANKVGARYALIEVISPRLSEYEKRKMVASKGDILVIIKLK